ncbi:MAG: nucleotide exchange factor GrpE [Ruminococcaceae bacterium]|nr:nucleotide exchange factor GrpE [Oscillospiraceae bacterium]
MSTENENKVAAEAEETVEEVTASNSEEESENQQQEQDALQKNYDELYDKHLRTLAEYENYKRRTQKEKDETYLNAQADAILNLLPVLDNLERAAATEEQSPLAEGVQMVLKQLIETLEKMGVHEIEAVGKAFDPNLHNAVMHIDDENFEENVVVEQFMKGYEMKGRVIRHSMVKVAN